MGDAQGTVAHCVARGLGSPAASNNPLIPLSPSLSPAIMSRTLSSLHTYTSWAIGRTIRTSGLPAGHDGQGQLAIRRRPESGALRSREARGQPTNVHHRKYDLPRSSVTVSGFSHSSFYNLFWASFSGARISEPAVPSQGSETATTQRRCGGAGHLETARCPRMTGSAHWNCHLNIQPACWRWKARSAIAISGS